MDEQDECISRLQFILRRLKYGLSKKKAIALYEWMFPDRVVAQELADIDLEGFDNKYDLGISIRKFDSEVREKLAVFPSYFTAKMDGII